MKLLTCPLNGKRNISEFTYGGEYHVMPDHRTSSARDSFWFLAERNTITDEVIRTFKADEIYQQRVEFTAPETEV